MVDEDFSGKLESSEIDGRGDAITKLSKQKIFQLENKKIKVKVTLHSKYWVE